VKKVKNVHWIRPKRKFSDVIKTHGWPIISKDQAVAISRYRNTKSEQQKYYRLNGFPNGKTGMISKKWQYLVNAPFKISAECCYFLKKYPLKKASGKHGSPFVGMMATDSDWRRRRYAKIGCNAYDQKQPMSMPLAFWREEDIWSYIQRAGIGYSSVYDMGYDRTGCMFCGFGVHMEGIPNRFQRMKKTHPKHWKYCMDRLGMREVIRYINMPIE